MNDVGVWMFLVVLLASYFLPLIVAASRSMPNVGSVAVVNIFLGWTVIGWIVALAMACGSSRPRGYPPQQWSQQPWGQPPPGQWPVPPELPPGS